LRLDGCGGGWALNYFFGVTKKIPPAPGRGWRADDAGVISQTRGWDGLELLVIRGHGCGWRIFPPESVQRGAGHAWPRRPDKDSCSGLMIQIQLGPSAAPSSDRRDSSHISGPTRDRPAQGRAPEKIGPGVHWRRVGLAGRPVLGVPRKPVRRSGGLAHVLFEARPVFQ